MSVLFITLKTVWLLLTIFSIAAIYIAIYFIEANVGNVSVIMPLAGTALLFQDLFVIFSWAGFILLIYTLEINYHVKTRYLFTIFSSFSLVFTIYALGTGQGMAAEVMLFIISMAGLLAIWYFMTVAMLGKLKRNLLSLTIGHLCMVFVYLLDTPLGKFMLPFLPEDIFLLVPPILINFGLILYFIGIIPLAVEWKSVYRINPSGMQQKN